MREKQRLKRTKWSWTIEIALTNEKDSRMNKRKSKTERTNEKREWKSWAVTLLCVCAHFCAGGSVVKLQEIRKLSPDQRLREKRADTVSPSAQFTSRAGETCCTGQSPEHWQRCFIFTCLFWELDGGKFDMTRLAKRFDMAACLRSNRERSNHHSLDQTFNYTDQTQTC